MQGKDPSTPHPSTLTGHHVQGPLPTLAARPHTRKEKRRSHMRGSHVCMERWTGRAERAPAPPPLQRSRVPGPPPHPKREGTVALTQLSPVPSTELRLPCSVHGPEGARTE